MVMKLNNKISRAQPKLVPKINNRLEHNQSPKVRGANEFFSFDSAQKERTSENMDKNSPKGFEPKKNTYKVHTHTWSS